MNIKKCIPNLLTLGNLFCGTVATIFAVEGDFVKVALFVILGILFDFLDGFIARLLNVSGEFGKQLDSLADMVTSGVVPGVIMFDLLSKAPIAHFFESTKFETIQFLGLLLTLVACYRLAKFNIDAKQSRSFIGLPTPAMSLFVISLPLIKMNTDFVFIKELITNNYFLILITFILSYLMNAKLPLFSLKFKNYSLKDNIIKYLFLVVSLIFILILKYLSIPLIIISYVLLSVVNNSLEKT